MEFIVTSYKDRRKTPCEAKVGYLRDCFELLTPYCWLHALLWAVFLFLRILFLWSTGRYEQRCGGTLRSVCVKSFEHADCS